MSIPPPPGSKDSKDSGELNKDESQLILDKTLKPAERSDPVLLAFIDSFVKCRSLKQACEDCNIDYSLGYRWRHRKSVANAIQKIIDRSAIKYNFDASEIFERAKELAESDPMDVFNPDGTFRKIHEIPAATRRAIKKFKVKNSYSKVEDINGIKSKIIDGQILEVEFWDKTKGIEMVGKEKEMFKNTTRVEHDVTNNMAEYLLESKRMAEARQVTVDKTTVIDVTDGRDDD